MLYKKHTTVHKTTKSIGLEQTTSSQEDEEDLFHQEELDPIETPLDENSEGLPLSQHLQSENLTTTRPVTPEMSYSSIVSQSPIMDAQKSKRNNEPDSQTEYSDTSIPDAQPRKTKDTFKTSTNTVRDVTSRKNTTPTLAGTGHKSRSQYNVTTSNPFESLSESEISSGDHRSRSLERSGLSSKHTGSKSRSRSGSNRQSS